MFARFKPSSVAIEAAGEPGDAGKAHSGHIAPVVWLIGKVQSGKTSIVRAITQSSHAEIGIGFKACTRSARVFDFPADLPILRFLDTRGLGESAYDPAADLAFAERQAHLLLVTMRATDMAQDAILDVVRTVRQRHPDWPVVVAQTALHEGYAAQQSHTVPYPFHGTDDHASEAAAVPNDLMRCLEHQRLMFSQVSGSAPLVFVPIDLTQDRDDMVPADYGLDALMDALVSVAPVAMRAALQMLPISATDVHSQRANPLILGHAMAAGGSDLIPIAGGVAASAIQARLLQRLGQIYGVTWTQRLRAEFIGALGAGVAARTLVGIGVRQLAKLVPFYGQTLAAATTAAMSYAITFALGKAAVHFLLQRQRGLRTDGTAQAYQAALREALRHSRSHLRQTV
jgi:uncharacterized protein (DUF697 family)/predicted GTPase